MWFGDLVTMKWWKYFWLNEGFATWFNYYVVDQIFPEWEIWAYFTEKHGAASLVSDTDSRSIPIEVEVNSFKDLYGVMNSPVIMYYKAAYIIQMLYTYLGPEIFQHSIASYIKEFSWSSVDSENLWTTIEKVSGKPIKNVMSQWTKLTGYPVVSVETSANNLLLKQSPMLSGPSHVSDVWTIPLTFCCGSYKTCYNFLMNQNSTIIELSNFKGCSCDTSNGTNMGCPWIKVNVNLTGFFRVMYDNNLSTRLAYAIQQKNLSHFDRFGILNDLNALSVNYNLQFHYLFALMDAYVDEDNLRVISALTPASNTVISITARAAPELLSPVKTFFAKLFKKYIERLGLDSRPNEGIVEKELRSDMLKRLAILGDESTLMEMTKRFEAYVADNNSPLLHPDIKEAAFIAVMQKANKSNTVDYETLLRIYNATNDNPDEQQPFLNALVSCPDPQILRESLDILFSPKNMKIWSPLKSRKSWYRRRKNMLQIWSIFFDKVNLEQIFYALDYVSWQCSETAWTWLKLTSPEKVNEVKDFFTNKKTLPSFNIGLESSILQINKKVTWAKKIREEKGLAEFIDKLVSTILK